MRKKTLLRICLGALLLLTPVVSLLAETETFHVNLEGTWKMKSGDSLDYINPLFDDSAWNSLELPHRFNLEKLGKKSGYIWFRRRFILNDSPGQDLLIQIREIMNADQVYINGELVGSGGRFPPEFRSGWSKFRSYKIPHNYLKAGNNTIAIRMYFDAEAWVTGPMLIVDQATGELSALWHDFILNHLLHGMGFLLIFIASFFIIFYFKRKEEVSYLYFALGAMSAGLAIALQFFENFYGVLPISSNTILLITQMGLLFLPVWLSFFFHHYLTERIGRVRFFVSLAFPVAGSLLMLIAADRSGILFWRNNFLIGFFLLFGELFVQSIIQRIKGNQKSQVMLIGLVPMLILGGHDIMAFALHWIDSTIALFIYGFPVLLLLLSAQLTNRFVLSLNKTEELNDTLNNMVESISRFVPSQFISHLHKENIMDVTLGDSLLNVMTVLFSDIRDFTRLSEKMSPEDNFRFLNGYMQRMEPSIDKNNGFIDKFIGDAIMALFADSPDSALNSAISMRNELKAYNYDRASRGYQPIDFGIGLNSGDVMLGTVGSTNRMDTTVIGTTVNLASRLEGLTKVYHTPIIISEFLYAQLGRTDDFDIRELDFVRVKGLEQAVRIYEVFNADEEQLRTAKQNSLEDFHAALDAYRRADFERALDMFKSIAAMRSGDRTTDIYVKRCEKLLVDPPGAKWAGISRLRA